MGWTPVEITRGDMVDTPHGRGKVVRISGAQNTAHVAMESGGTLEIPMEQITQSPQGGKSEAKQPSGQPQEGKQEVTELKVGDKVRRISDGARGTISRVLMSGSVEFKHSANGKKTIQSRENIEKIEKPSDIPQDNPSDDKEFKVGDRVRGKGDNKYTGTVLKVGKPHDINEITVARDDGMGHDADGDAPDGNGWWVDSNNLEHLPPEEDPKAPKQEDKKEDKKEDKDKGEQPKDTKDVVEQTGDGLMGLMQLKEHLEKRIDEQVDGELAELREAVKSHRKLDITIGDEHHVLEGSTHKQLETLITYAALRLPVLLVGMAGTGKTHAGEQVSEALKVPFYAMSVGAQTSKSDIIGYMDANGRYVKTFFRDAYENGGVFLMDEIDAGNANVLIQVNAALSNGLCAFPDAMVRKHEDFIFVASANTYGNGASRQYVGRNQLDAATLDRFAIIDWKIDDELERSLSVGTYGDAWYKAVVASRKFVADKGIRAVISPRATQKGSRLLASGVHVSEVISAVLLGSVPEDKREDVTKVATTIFDGEAKDVPSKVKEAIQTADYPF